MNKSALRRIHLNTGVTTLRLVRPADIQPEELVIGAAVPARDLRHQLGVPIRFTHNKPGLQSVPNLEVPHVHRLIVTPKDSRARLHIPDLHIIHGRCSVRLRRGIPKVGV